MRTKASALSIPFLSKGQWISSQSLAVSSPALCAVGRELPSLLNLRLVSRALGGYPEVAALAGNSIFGLKALVLERRPQTIVVEFIPDHLEALFAFGVWLSANLPNVRLLVVGSGLRFWGDHLKVHGPPIELVIPGNPIKTLADLTADQAHSYLRPPASELLKQPLWEKRRVAVALGCPCECRVCSRSVDEGTLVLLRSVSDVMDEIAEKLHRFGIRDVEVVGAGWASDAEWAQSFLEARIQKGLELRLQLVVTPSQLTKEIVRLLAPAGCTQLTIRCSLEDPKIDQGLTESLRDLSGRGRIVLICAVNVLQESPHSAAFRVALLKKALFASSIHVLLHNEIDVPPSCSELGRCVAYGGLNLHLGVTQRSNNTVRSWTIEFASVLAPAYQ